MQIQCSKTIGLVNERRGGFWIVAQAVVYLTLVFATTEPVGAAWNENEQPSGQSGRDPGKTIYLVQCASCHGHQGQGSEVYPEALQGEKSVAELQEYIAAAMPEGKPDKCVGDHARDVAEFIFHEFYSNAAQKKLPPPRVELSRLTVRQYRQSVADLVNSFSDPLWYTPDRGLNANYFAARNWTEPRRLAKQQDANIDFGDGVPHFDPTDKYEQLEPVKNKANKMNDGFSAYWQGAILAPETGQYEFVVESKNGFGLWINNRQTELIDRWVRSDDENVHAAKIFLLGGRAYPLKLQLFSYPDPPAKIRLVWTPPGGSRSVVPQSALMPQGMPASIAVSTPFPADDASAGYQRGISVSRQWDESTTQAAVETAEWIASRIWKLAGTKNTADDRVEKVKRFCRKFVERAFVKPLNDEEFGFFVGQNFENDLRIQDQVKRVVILALKSPRFLFPTIENRDVNFEIARQMALVLWDSIPDEKLFKMAADGKLADLDVVNGELHRMVNDPRAKSKLRAFFHDWLKTNKAAEATKDKSRFPDFDDRVLSDLRRSLDLYLDEVAWSEASDFRQLFLADYLFVNKRLARFYDLRSELPEFVKVKVDPDERAGILSHPYLMTGLAYHKDSSPIHRGVFVGQRLLGRQLRQPPEAVEPLTEEFNPKMTTRQRVEHQTKDAACMNCHRVINPLGFSLENFDAVGRFRTQEKQKTIDAATIYQTPDGVSIPLAGARDLANFLAHDKTAQRSFVIHVFQYFAKQPVAAYGEQRLEQMHEKFVATDFNIRQLLIEVAMVTSIPENLPDHEDATDAKVSGDHNSERQE